MSMGKLAVMMVMMWHAFLWGSVLSVQSGCLLDITEWRWGALAEHRQQESLLLQRGEAPAGGAVTDSNTHTDGRLMLLMELHNNFSVRSNRQSSQRHQQFISVEEAAASIHSIDQGCTGGTKMAPMPLRNQDSVWRIADEWMNSD